MFFLQTSDVTQGQWERVMEKTLKRAKGEGD
jgi:formylglycine-generating enzyme required for sulfatase activity